jgi:hypothetical protein
MGAFKLSDFLTSDATLNALDCATARFRYFLTAFQTEKLANSDGTVDCVGNVAG